MAGTYAIGRSLPSRAILLKEHPGSLIIAVSVKLTGEEVWDVIQKYDNGSSTGLGCYSAEDIMGAFEVQIPKVEDQCGADQSVSTVPVSDIKRMNIKEFRSEGYLRELNRRFLHLVGLALETVILDDGTERFGGIWDYREDPEGMGFSADMIHDTAREQSARIDAEIESKRKVREEQFGAIIQPLINSVDF